MGLFVQPDEAKDYESAKINVVCKPYDMTVNRKLYPKTEMITATELDAEHSDFGGFSGMALKSDGSKLYAITDRARFLEAEPEANKKGGISCLRNVKLTPIRGTSGNTLTGSYLDSEGMTFGNKKETKIWISFERRPRVIEYNLNEEKKVPVRELTQPEIKSELTYNESYEAVRLLRNGEILLFPEYLPEKKKPENLRGYYLTKADRWKQVRIIQADAGRYVTDILELKTGDILTIERAFSVLTGPTVKLRRFKRKEFFSGVPQKGEILAAFNLKTGTDNFEAAASLPVADGELIYLMSDDNFIGLQKTLLITLKIHD